MKYNNKKKDYPLYETVAYADIRAMLLATAEKFADRFAISYRPSPNDSEAHRLTYARVAADVEALAREAALRRVLDDAQNIL